MPFSFQATEIEGPLLVIPRVFEDSRGLFFESYKQSDFVANGIPEPILQNNASRSSKNVLRGLHYQMTPHDQAKLVRCVQGAIYDVAVDIRRSSSNFGRWIARELNEDNRHMLYVPAGFAHGFLTLSDVAEVNYSVSAEYHPASERGIIWNDPDIGIAWPIETPLLSDKDDVYPRLKEAEVFEDALSRS